jgi:hypothetical protein
MKTRRSFLYTLAVLPLAVLVPSKFDKQPELKTEITSDDLLFRVRPYYPTGLLLTWNKEKERWEET